MIHDLDTQQDYDRLLQASYGRPVLLLKHSTRCPISAAAWREFQAFAQAGDPGADLVRVLVIENKSLSQHIAQDTGVKHDSPQLLVFYQARVVSNSSHWSITADSISRALKEVRG